MQVRVCEDETRRNRNRGAGTFSHPPTTFPIVLFVTGTPRIVLPTSLFRHPSIGILDWDMHFMLLSIGHGSQFDIRVASDFPRGIAVDIDNDVVVILDVRRGTDLDSAEVGGARVLGWENAVGLFVRWSGSSNDQDS